MEHLKRLNSNLSSFTLRLLIFFTKFNHYSSGYTCGVSQNLYILLAYYYYAYIIYTQLQKISKIFFHVVTFVFFVLFSIFFLGYIWCVQCLQCQTHIFFFVNIFQIINKLHIIQGTLNIYYCILLRIGRFSFSQFSSEN